MGVSRVVSLPTTTTFFGFEEAGDPARVGFGQGPFYSGASGSSSTNFSLADSAFRVLILAKALANICDGSIPAINQLLLNLFPKSGNVYCTDGLDDTMTYTLAFKPTAVQLAILNSGVVPRPSGSPSRS